MAEVDIKCSDGSSDCFGTVRTQVRFAGLSSGQLDEISDGGGRAEILLTPLQVELNRARLTPDELESLEDDGGLYVEVTAAQTICAGCGSDYSYDSEGRIIS